MTASQPKPRMTGRHLEILKSVYAGYSFVETVRIANTYRDRTTLKLYFTLEKGGDVLPMTNQTGEKMLENGLFVLDKKVENKRRLTIRSFYKLKE